MDAAKREGFLGRAAVLLVVSLVAVALSSAVAVPQAGASTVRKAGWYTVEGSIVANGDKPSKARIGNKWLKVKAATYCCKGKDSLRRTKMRGRSHEFRLAKKVRFYDLEVGEERMSSREGQAAINQSGRAFGVLVVHVNKSHRVNYIGFHG